MADGEWKERGLGGGKGEDGGGGMSNKMQVDKVYTA